MVDVAGGVEAGDESPERISFNGLIPVKALIPTRTPTIAPAAEANFVKPPSPPGCFSLALELSVPVGSSAMDSMVLDRFRSSGRFNEEESPLIRQAYPEL